MANREGATRQRLTASNPPILITETYRGGRWVVTGRVRQPTPTGKLKPLPARPGAGGKVPAPMTRPRSAGVKYGKKGAPGTKTRVTKGATRKYR